MWYQDATMLLLIPAMLLSLYAQFKVSGTFNKFSRVRSSSGMTGADVARALLAKNGVTDVAVEHIRGNLTDHYDPRTKKVRLSDAVFGSTSIAAISVAAHETGHAMQHSLSYAPLGIRSSIAPVVGFSSKLATPLIILGIVLSSASGSLGLLLLEIGIILFAAVVVFQIVTLPVEFNASSRAIGMMEENGILSSGEVQPARKVLNAAALTYVAAAAVAVMNLIRFILILNSRSRD